MTWDNFTFIFVVQKPFQKRSNSGLRIFQIWRRPRVSSFRSSIDWGHRLSNLTRIQSFGRSPNFQIWRRSRVSSFTSGTDRGYRLSNFTGIESLGIQSRYETEASSFKCDADRAFRSSLFLVLKQLAHLVTRAASIRGTRWLSCSYNLDPCQS